MSLHVIATRKLSSEPANAVGATRRGMSSGGGGGNTRGRASRQTVSQATQNAPHTGEEASLWANALGQLNKIVEQHNKIDRISADANEAQINLNEDTEPSIISQLETLYREGVTNSEIQQQTVQSAKESLGILIALLQASEASVEEKKRKRKADTEIIEQGMRNKKTRGPQANEETIQPGSQVAFHTPRKGGQEGDWIQCIVLKVTGEGAKQRFEVQDPEPDEKGTPGETFRTTAQNLILLPSSKEGLPSFQNGATVLARYPETTTFYPAQYRSMKRDGTCKLVFDGDHGKETEVDRLLVLEHP